jgi:hypothetical protein
MNRGQTGGAGGGWSSGGGGRAGAAAGGYDVERGGNEDRRLLICLCLMIVGEAQFCTGNASPVRDANKANASVFCPALLELA